MNSNADIELIKLTPFTILFTTLALVINQHVWSKQFILGLIAVASLGFILEAIGVNTAFPFGEYHYSDVLGIKLFETPIIMGINWLMLVYAAVFIVRRIGKNTYVQALLAGIILVGLDILIEPVAIQWNMWTWKGSDIPIENFITWGIAASLFSFILLKSVPVNAENKMGLPVLLVQFAFFLILGSCC